MFYNIVISSTLVVLVGACQSQWSDPGLKIIILVDIIMKIQLSVQHQIQYNHVSAAVLTTPFPLQGYRLYFSTKNVTSMQPVGQNKSAMVETLTQLSEFSNSPK